MTRLAYTVLALTVALPSMVAGASLPSDITDFCDLNDSAAISDKCFGFVSAVIETVQILHVTHQATGVLNACIPFGTTVEQAVPKIRPFLRVRKCLGMCSATTYVERDLYETYPCK
jgi:hypothetical protein